MTRRQDELALRRRTLQLRSDRLRRDFMADARTIEESVGRAGRALGVVQRFSPLLVLAGGAAVFLLRRRLQPLTWLTRGLLALSVLRRASALIRGSLPRSPTRE